MCNPEQHRLASHTKEEPSVHMILSQEGFADRLNQEAFIRKSLDGFAGSTFPFWSTENFIDRRLARLTSNSFQIPSKSTLILRLYLILGN